ncbi:MAG: CHASE2 domain-containing protein [Microcystaceae cyanobacterium]
MVLKLDGNIEQLGFRVTLEIGSEGERPQIEMTGLLPPDLGLVKYLEQWQKQYRTLGAPTRIRPQVIIYEGSINQLESCRQAANQLRDRLNFWLESESFRPLDKRLREQLSRDEPIRVLLRTQDNKLRQLPWYLWDFIERYPKAEIAFSTPAFERVETIRSTPLKSQKKVRILAILGHSWGINIETDRRLLANLPDAEVEFLVEPQRQQLSEQLWDRAWDILFFAGHSETEGERGRIYLNPSDSLTIEELRYALRRAIAQGLQLAIFNSCDGCGLAQELEQLQLPQIIVMREPVPDRIAQEFLKHFLGAFSSGDSLYEAERQARERLQGLEDDFPCASWLPIIYQNPAAVPPDWQTLRLRGQEETQEAPKPSVFRFRRRRLTTVLIASLLSTSLLVGVRSLGILQNWELKAFDQLVRLRPTEEADERIFVVTIDEADIQYQKQMGMNLQGSLSDSAIAQLLKKLAPYRPRAIGSDIVHDFSFAPDAAKAIEQMPQFIAICRVNSPESHLVSIAPPPVLAVKQLGFTNFSLDADGVVRRQILGMASDNTCQTEQSFSFRIALRYLKNPPVQQTPAGLQIGSTVLKQLEPSAGGYQLSPKETLGYQILLNYRASEPRKAPLRAILSGAMDSQLAKLVKDRIVLIGLVDANGKQDSHFTPYSMGEANRQMPGVLVHAQMVSQIVSAVAEKRSLLWWWPQWAENLWIGIWSLVGGVLVWFWRQSLLYQGLAIITALGSLLGVCFVLLLAGGWVPLVPAALVLLVTAASLAFYNLFQSKQQQKRLNSKS